MNKSAAIAGTGRFMLGILSTFGNALSLCQWVAALVGTDHQGTCPPSPRSSCSGVRNKVYALPGPRLPRMNEILKASANALAGSAQFKISALVLLKSFLSLKKNRGDSPRKTT